MKEGIEGIENEVVKKQKSSRGSDKKGVVGVGDRDRGEVLKRWFMGEIEVDEEEFGKVQVGNFGGFLNV